MGVPYVGPAPSDPSDIAPKGYVDTTVSTAIATAVHLTGAETVAGIKTFSSAPVVPANSFPESAITNLTTDLSAKALNTAVVHNTGAETVAGVKTFSSAPVVPSNSFPESAVTNLTTDLAAKATDTSVVHLAGAETISGVKTFSAAPAVPNNSFPESAITNLVSDLAGKYVKPSGGIPATDIVGTDLPISTATQTALNGLYTKPASGIPLSDLGPSVTALLTPNFQRVVRTSTASQTSSTTLTSDSVLTLPVVANGVYAIEAMVFYDGDNTGDIKIGLAAPAGSSTLTTFHGYYDGTTAGNTGTAMTDNGRATKAVSTLNSTWGSLGGIGAGNEAWLNVKGTINIGDSAGNVAFMWAQNVSSTTALILHVGSELSVTRIA